MALTKQQKNLILYVTAPLLFGVIVFVFWPKDQKANYDDLVAELEKDPKNRNLNFLKPADRKRLFEGGGSDIPLTRKNRPLIYASTANDYRRRAQYPHYSEPIPVFDGRPVDSVFEDFNIAPTKVAHPKHPEGPYLYHFISKNNYEPGETVAIHAFMTDGKDKIVTDKLTAQLVDLTDRQKGVNVKKRMLDEGGFKDKPGDKTYTATFTTRSLTKMPHNYSIILKYDDGGEKEITATNAFTLGRLGISLEKEFEDAISAGEKGNSLIIRAKVRVEVASAYWAQASLYTDDGYPIGRAQTRVEFKPGIHWLELKWYGKLICDSKRNGPYRLRYLMLANVKQMPGPRSGGYLDMHDTQAYEFSQFTCTSFDDEVYLKKAEAIEEEIKEILNE